MSFWSDYNCNRYDPDSHENIIVCDSEYVTEKELSDAKDLIIETTKEYADEYTVDQAKEHAEALQTAFENEFTERADTFENGINTRVASVEGVADTASTNANNAVATANTASTVADEAKEIADIINARQSYLDLYVLKDYSTEGSGDNNIIITPNGKVLIIDVGSYGTSTIILDKLNDLNITHVDYLVISHYHTDHVGGDSGQGIVDLINADLIDENTTVYLPHESLDLDTTTFTTDQNIKNTKTAIVSALTNTACNMEYPETEGEEVTIDENTKIRFLNVSASYFEVYKTHNEGKDGIPVTTGGCEYNNFSMVVELTAGVNKYLFPGDIFNAAQEKISDSINDIKVLKVEHHSHNATTNEKYLIKVGGADVAIAGCNLENFNNNWGLTPTIAKIAESGKVYTTGVSGNIHLTDRDGTINVDSDYGASNYNAVMTCGMRLTGAVDLNNILSIGSYECIYANTTSISNAPISADFTLRVLPYKYKYITQIVEYKNSRRIFFRNVLTNNGSARFEDGNAKWAEIVTANPNINNIEPLTLTYVTNNFVGETQFESRCKAYRSGDIITLNLNIVTTDGASAPSDFTVIGKVEGVTLVEDVYITVPSQKSTTYAPAILQIQTNGNIRYYASGNTGSWYRAHITGMLKYY